MNIEERLQCIVEQPRAYVYGTVELVNDEWIFFDDEEEEASLVEEMAEQGIEWFHCGHWLSGQWQDQARSPRILRLSPRKRRSHPFPQTADVCLSAMACRPFGFNLFPVCSMAEQPRVLAV
ncbi:hypothetical protein LR69_04203 [Geobacillus sp. BCO2]|nr:hypothetical protein LR69_04203 [Geobacillus sp. BCO2]